MKVTMNVRQRCGHAVLIPLLAVASMAQTARDERIANAAERRDVKAVQTLLAQGADVNGRQGDGATALHWAAHSDDLETVERLLRAKASVDVANDLGVTPLALASETGNAAMVERLLQAGANPNSGTASGETALMTAARTGSVGAVQALLARGADVNAKEQTHGQTALMWAVSNGHPSIVRALLEKKADVHARSTVRSRVLHTGNRFGDRNESKGVATLALGGYTPLLFAARQGDVESGTLLLAAGANPNDKAPVGTTALVVAAHSGNGAFAMKLLEAGADPNDAGAGYTALHAAILRGDVELVRALIARKADVNAPIAKGTPSRYYSKDWALNGTALAGATPLWQAARYGDVATMKLLAAAGADPKFAMADGTTVLIAAVQANHGFGTGDRYERYLGPGDLVSTDEEKQRVTIGAATAALDLGVPIDAATATGDTALHAAAQQGLDAVVQLLSQRGANLEIANKRGLTPLAVAIAPRPPNPLQIDGPERRAAAAAALRKLGAKEPDPAVFKQPQRPRVPTGFEPPPDAASPRAPGGAPGATGGQAGQSGR